jgi:aspartyl-tRNA(Asn)/glutamyl-tRNA(Gln) amidotransferase subunit A
VDAPWQLGVTLLSEAFARKDLSPVEVFDTFISRRDAINPALNAIVGRDDDRARSTAQASESRYARGEPLGPLDGVPITVKDCLFVAGQRITWGSRLFADCYPDADDVAVGRLRDAGVVIAGITNCSELSFQAHTDNPVFGVTRNPWNTERSVGGSSGGAVAAVASGLGPIALGTDAGGSVRRPAALTGLVGFKPSPGKLPGSSSFPPIFHDLQVTGTIARSVGDAALMFDALSDPVAADAPSPHRLRILYVSRAGNSPVDPEIDKSVSAAARSLAEIGHIVEEGAAPYDYEEVGEYLAILARAGIAQVVEPYPDWRECVDSVIATMAERGLAMRAVDYVRTIEAVIAFRVNFAEIWRSTDFILTPMSACLPWPVEEAYPRRIDGREAGRMAGGVFGPFVNLAGAAAISLPASPSSKGLPIGIQLIGPPGQESRLVALARQYEAACPWAHRWPAIAEV